MTMNVETKKDLVKISAINFKHLTKKQQKEVKLRYPNINFGNKEELDGIIIEVEPRAKRRVNKIVKAMKQGEINKIQRDKEYKEYKEYRLEQEYYDEEEEEIQNILDDEHAYLVSQRDKLIDRFIELNYNDISFEDWLDGAIRLDDVMKENRQAIIDYYNKTYKKDSNELNRDMIVKFMDILTDYPNHAIRHHLDNYRYNKEYLELLNNNYVKSCNSKEDHNNFCDAFTERETIMNLHKEEFIQLITKQLTNN
jgi:hypothetical protein